MTLEEGNETLLDSIEYKLFASCLKEPGAIGFYADQLDHESVGHVHGEIGIHELFCAFVDFHKKTGLDYVDQVAFKVWLETETDVYKALGGQEGFDALVGSILNIDYPDKKSIVEIIKYKEIKKNLKDNLSELNYLLSKKGYHSDEDSKRISFLTNKISELQSFSKRNPFSDVTTAQDIINRSETLLDIPDFVPTQFKALNRAMGYTDEGGFFKGAVHAIIAPSGKGKSTFAKCLANNWLDNGYRVLYVNFEEAIGHWERVLMTQILGVNVYAESGKWNDQQKKSALKKFKEKLETWGDRLMVRHDPDTPYFEDLESWLREIIGKNYNLPDIVIIDTIQSMFTRGSGKGKPRWGEFEEMMVKLEKLARDMNCVLIITAQENANRMKEKREVVQQSDTGGSLAIQQKCAVTIFITEKRLISEDETEDENIMQLQIPKNRITGSSFVYDPPLVRYVDSKKIYEDYEIVTESSYSEGTDLYNLINEESFY
jgi:replicative DNA helicase